MTPMTQTRLEPKLLRVFREGYSGALFIQDLAAGVIVGIVALPLAIAFAIASGVAPEQGLATAIVAGMVHALTLLFVVLFFGKWASLIPLASLAGILLVVAYNMSEWHLFVKLFRSTKSDVTMLLTTFLLTGLVDLTVAIQAGIVLAALLFMRRMADDFRVGYVTPMLEEDEEAAGAGETAKRRAVPKGVEVFEVNGPFFFGAADKFKYTLSLIQKKPKVLVLRLESVMSLDATGLRALEDVFGQTSREGTTLILSGVREQPERVMARSGFLDRVGIENTADHIDEALQLAKLAMDRKAGGRA